MKWLRALVVATLCLVPIGASAWWQSVAQQSVGAVVAYQGPGDVYDTAYIWWSCARAYNAAYANGTNPLCDLVDKTAGTTAVCTLRVATTGFADLSNTYCTGGTQTPSAACAAAAGGGCRVSKVYDQTGNSRDGTPGATPTDAPDLTFSAVNGLPAMTFSANQRLGTAGGTVTLTQPYTMSAVYKRTSGATLGGLLSDGGAQTGLFVSATSGQAALLATTEVDAAASENNWHGFQGLASGTGNNCATNLDSADIASRNCGTSGISGGTLRAGRSSASVTIAGQIVETGVWAKTSTPTDRGNVYSNQHGVNGYNGAF